MADGNIGIGRGRGNLPGQRIADADKACRHQQNNQYDVGSHITAPLARGADFESLIAASGIRLGVDIA